MGKTKNLFFPLYVALVFLKFENCHWENHTWASPYVDVRRQVSRRYNIRRVIWRNCYRATAHIVALFGHCDWNLNFIHRLVYIRPVTYSNRTVCIRASCPYVPSHNTAVMLPIILISIAIIRADWIRKVQTPSILQRDVFRVVKSNVLELTCRVVIRFYRLDFLRQLDNVPKWVTATNSNFAQVQD